MKYAFTGSQQRASWCALYLTWGDFSHQSPIMGWEPAGRWLHLRHCWIWRGTFTAFGSSCYIICFPGMRSFLCLEPGNKTAHCGGRGQLSNRRTQSLKDFSKSIRTPSSYSFLVILCVSMFVCVHVSVFVCECWRMALRVYPNCFLTYFWSVVPHRSWNLWFG